MKRCKYNVLVEWETREKTHEPLPVLAADDPVTCASYTKGNGISYLNGWKRFKNIAKRDKHDLSCIASPKGEMKSTFSWTSLCKTPTSSTLCFGEPTLAELNHEPTLAELNHEPTLAELKHEPTLQRSIKSCCCVKLSLTSQSLHLFGTPNRIFMQHTNIPSSNPT